MNSYENLKQCKSVCKEINENLVIIFNDIDQRQLPSYEKLEKVIPQLKLLLSQSEETYEYAVKIEKSSEELNALQAKSPKITLDTKIDKSNH